MKNQRGFTVVELLTAVSAIASLALIGLVVWAAFHFISKFWQERNVMDLFKELDAARLAYSASTE